MCAYELYKIENYLVNLAIRNQIFLKLYSDTYRMGYTEYIPVIFRFL